LVRLLGLPSQRPATETARLLQLALPVARTPGERRVILAGLSRLPHPASLAAITPFLADPTVRTEAALAVVRVAQYLGGIAPAAAATALDQVEQHVQASDLLKAAQAARTRIETWAGNVEVWRLAGPWATSAQTGEGTEPALPKLADAAWRLVPAAEGRLKITPLAGRAPQVAVLRTELLVPEAAQAVFRLQHRGRAILQLDGQPLPRAGREDADPRPALGQITGEFPTPLSAGRHAVQIVTFRPSDGAEWQLSLQITTPDGAPLPALRTRPEP